MKAASNRRRQREGKNTPTTPTLIRKETCRDETEPNTHKHESLAIRFHMKGARVQQMIDRGCLGATARRSNVALPFLLLVPLGRTPTRTPTLITSITSSPILSIVAIGAVTGLTKLVIGNSVILLLESGTLRCIVSSIVEFAPCIITSPRR